MGMGEERGGADDRSRRVVYCVLPYELAGRLHEPLRRHFRAEPGVEVIVDRRRRVRRSGADRRRADAEMREERRAIRSHAGRRVGERRAVTVPIPAEEAPELPRRLRRWAERVSFVERFEPATQEAEDMEATRTVLRFQAGDRQAFHTLYVRFFDSVYSYFRVLLKNAHEAEDATQDVFEGLMTSLRDYERTDRPFRAWLFTVVRNHALNVLRKSSRVEVIESAALDAQLEQLPGTTERLSALDWISERELLLLVERLPAEQRQVLALRYVVDLKPNEIAEILGMSPNHVSVLHYRAICFLRTRLEGLGHRVERRDRRARMRGFPKQAQVLRRRRFALTP